MRAAGKRRGAGAGSENATDDVGRDRERIEIHLEEIGQHSWWKSLLNTLTGSYGSAQFRFIARPVSTPDAICRHVATGPTFPLMRFSDLNDQTDRNGWIELARAALDELDAELVSDGWRRCAERGKHWWSLLYEWNPDARTAQQEVQQPGDLGAHAQRRTIVPDDADLRPSRRSILDASMVPTRRPQRESQP